MGRSSGEKPEISAATLRRVVAEVPCGLAITDRTRKGNPVIFVNRAYETLTGFAAEEVLGRGSSFLLGKDTRQENHAQIRQAIRSGKGCTAVLRSSRKDGIPFHCEVSLAPLPDGSGETALLIWLFRDVSSWLLREEGLKALIAEKEDRFSAYVEQANEAVWRIDFEPALPIDVPKEEQVRRFFDCAFYSEANDAVAKVYGLTSGRDVVGRPLREFMPASDPKNREVVAEFVRNNYQMDNLISFETTADGTKTVAVNNIKACIEDGMVRYLWGASLDLSDFFEAQHELEMSQKELAAANTSLEEKNSALRELIALVEEEKSALKDKVAANVEQVLVPILDRIQVGNGQDIYVAQLRRSLEDLTSSFGHRLMAGRMKLTPREVEVCTLVKDGLSNKEIAQALKIAVHTVEKHRRTARNKLGLANKGINLRTFLTSI